MQFFQKVRKLLALLYSSKKVHINGLDFCQTTLPPTHTQTMIEQMIRQTTREWAEANWWHSTSADVWKMSGKRKNMH